MPSSRIRLVGAAFFALVAALIGPGPLARASDAITWGKQGEVLSYDPQHSGDGTSWDLFFLVYEQLLSTDDNFHLTPGLAERWEQISPTSYRFHLAQDAAFSSGRALTADDVVGSFKRLSDPKTGGVWGKQLGKIAAIVAEDDHTVRFDLEEPNSAFLNVLASAPTSILPIKELNDGSFDPKKALLGSGPFMVAEHVQDQYWKLARNPHYWRKNRPIADEFVIKILPNDSTRIAALRDGLVDVATFDNADISRLLRSEPKIKVIKQNTTNFYRLDVSAREEGSPFADKRVRQAMHYALDREAIANIVLGGEAKVEYPIPSGLGLDVCRKDPFYAEPRAERLVKARALLKDAGKEGVEVGVIGSSALAAYPLIAQVIQSSLNEAGFKAKVEEIPAADWYKRVFVAHPRFDLAVSWYAGYTDPAMVLYWWTPEGSKGWADGYTLPDDALTAAIQKVRSLPNGPERLAAMDTACGLIDEDSNVIALVGKPDYIAYRDDLVKVRFGANEGYFRTFKYAEEFSRQN
jgi:peptide/nickel transport system substrate-binding protein